VHCFGGAGLSRKYGKFKISIIFVQYIRFKAYERLNNNVVWFLNPNAWNQITHQIMFYLYFLRDYKYKGINHCLKNNIAVH
jgi:hypothetical protein